MIDFNQLHDPKLPIQDSILARSITLYDNKDRPRATIGALDDKPIFGLCDEEGHPRVIITLNDGAPVVELLDRSGEVRLTIGLTSLGNSQIVVGDPDGVRADLVGGVLELLTERDS